MLPRPLVFDASWDPDPPQRPRSGGRTPCRGAAKSAGPVSDLGALPESDVAPLPDIQLDLVRHCLPDPLSGYAGSTLRTADSIISLPDFFNVLAKSSSETNSSTAKSTVLLCPGPTLTRAARSPYCSCQATTVYSPGGTPLISYLPS